MDATTDRKPVPQQRPLKPLRSNSPKTQYLIIYNFASAVLWTAVLGRVLLLVPLVGFGRAYQGVGVFTKWTQTMALLEVVHAATGIVRAPISTTAMQVASRLLLVWGVVNNFPFLAKSAAYSSMLVAWSVTEVIRYSYFTFTLSGFQPGFISWLRYNTFFILYPLGISSECWLIFKAIKPARAVRQEYAWILQLILFIYIPGSYILFTHMMAQRRKVMRGKSVQKAR
ncbi:very-long-chain (3R)-3-hydroxyacyl-CoA dehydratase [Coleophoma cylindrospora]|uniref:Very-long-chain (3R)-3-hydroxyacyl-CoA dehydratase n=1 Tax=Coleophoma cylindrospora TaxID=1849047 RepID=A0A3D8SR13_9HELO|nr:very-long-chain (3R)-3-hydroxyacyl-CoA dehydratase [Coleophoma cylindrospora]